MKNLLQVFKAVSSSFIGVGKKQDLIKNFERAENNGPWPYIIVGVVFTILFIFTIIFIVNLVL